MQKEIPILFSTAMVQALLDGRKTVTRRTVKHRISYEANRAGRTDLSAFGILDRNGNYIEKEEGLPATLEDGFSPYGKPGDVLWVRESWARFAGDVPSDVNSVKYQFKADTPENKYAGGWDNSWKSNEVPWWCKWKPSIHMPKEASRIWLQVESVSVERLLDINEADANAEGILRHKDEHGRFRYKDYSADASGYGHHEHDYPTVGIATTSFLTLWEKINGVESLQANPWVFVVKFKVLSTTGKPEDIK